MEVYKGLPVQDIVRLTRPMGKQVPVHFFPLFVRQLVENSRHCGIVSVEYFRKSTESDNVDVRDGRSGRSTKSSVQRVNLGSASPDPLGMGAAWCCSSLIGSLGIGLLVSNSILEPITRST
jgi:hypothetical protein